MIRTKFVLQSVTEHNQGIGKTLFQYKFSAVNSKDSEENKVFGQYTPTGTVDFMAVTKLDMEVGKSYYVDFSVAP